MFIYPATHLPPPEINLSPPEVNLPPPGLHLLPPRKMGLNGTYITTCSGLQISNQPGILDHFQWRSELKIVGPAPSAEGARIVRASWDTLP